MSGYMFPISSQDEVARRMTADLERFISDAPWPMTKELERLLTECFKAGANSALDQIEIERRAKA